MEATEESMPVELEPFNSAVPTEEPATVDDDEKIENEDNSENIDNAENVDNSENAEENPFADDDDSDEEGGAVQVTIRKIDTSQFTKPAHTSQQGKIDMDATPTVNDKPIYDLDLAQMEDKPWRKPGADITDYFNYGFSEESWNIYCERQKKLRAEFSNNQAAANKALFSNIQVSNPLANPIIQNLDPASTVKVLTDNGGRFKPQYVQQNKNQITPIPPQSSSQQSQPNLSQAVNSDNIIRTVIPGSIPPSGGTQPMDFSKPPPGMSMPPPGIPPTGFPTGVPPPTSSAISHSDAPPGIDSASEKPPGVMTPPGVSKSIGIPGSLDLNLGMPPPNFNPSLPPPGLGGGIGGIGMMNSNMPPPGFNMPPPSFSQHSGNGFQGMPPPLVAGPGFTKDQNDYEEEDRRSRRKRSRSRSPKRDRETRRRGDRDRGSERSSRRHRSRSASTDRKRHRDDRDKKESRRDRRDDDDGRKKSSKSSRREDDDDRRERKEKRSRHSDHNDGDGILSLDD